MDGVDDSIRYEDDQEYSSVESNSDREMANSQPYVEAGHGILSTKMQGKIASLYFFPIPCCSFFFVTPTISHGMEIVRIGRPHLWQAHLYLLTYNILLPWMTSKRK